MGGLASDYYTLSLQDSVTSNWIITSLANDAQFQAFGKSETESILARDAEDDEKLAGGIKIAVDKGVLAKITPPPYTKVDVLGKTADEVADEIIAGVGADASKGCVIVLCGLSGTGKGTTVAKLMDKLPKTVSWSNGNVFRSLTMLCTLYCQQNKIDFSEAVLTAENLASWIGMLSFGKFEGEYDIRIKGLGVDTSVNKNNPTASARAQSRRSFFLRLGREPKNRFERRPAHRASGAAARSAPTSRRAVYARSPGPRRGRRPRWTRAQSAGARPSRRRSREGLCVGLGGGTGV